MENAETDDITLEKVWQEYQKYFLELVEKGEMLEHGKTNRNLEKQ